VRAILTYHSIDDTGSVISVSRDRFAAHVRWLVSGVVSVLPLADIANGAGGDSAVAITFDDAFENFATAAWPLLREHALPVTVFVPTSYVGGTNAWDTMPGGDMPPLRLVGWPMLGQLASEGVTLGAHTRTHPDLRALSAEAMDAEIAGSIEDIERETGQHPESFAYPYGYLNETAVATARRRCRWAVTTKLAPVSRSSDPHRLPRLDAYFLRGPGRLEAFGSRPFAMYMSARAAVRRLRRR
jgi:peptidoglycan/xylan/chitin deacetylase (PgdA/CDA1 family)